MEQKKRQPNLVTTSHILTIKGVTAFFLACNGYKHFSCFTCDLNYFCMDERLKNGQHKRKESD
jgi:hypothetical protein